LHLKVRQLNYFLSLGKQSSRHPGSNIHASITLTDTTKHNGSTNIKNQKSCSGHNSITDHTPATYTPTSKQSQGELPPDIMNDAKNVEDQTTTEL
jgi:hypothetical protein